MSKNLHLKIDGYLSGNLSSDELKEFEEELKNNKKFAKEVEEQSKLIKLMDEHYSNLRIKNNLNAVHHKHKIKPEKNKSKLVRLITTISVAASISIIATLSTLYISGWYNYGKHVEKFTQLHSKIDNISSVQESIWEEFSNSKKKKKETAPSYPFGTSFSIASNGYLATNYHVINGVDSIYVSCLLDSVCKYKAELIMKDKKHDLAILKINDANFESFGKLPYVIDNKETILSEQVYTLGYSKRDIVYSNGSVSSLTGFRSDTTSYQISIPLNPGNSGSPLINSKGNILGIISGKHSVKEGTAFAKRSLYLTNMLDSISNDTSLVKPEIQKHSSIKWMKRTDQVKKLQPYIYKVEVFKSRE